MDIHAKSVLVLSLGRSCKQLSRLDNKLENEGQRAEAFLNGLLSFS